MAEWSVIPPSINRVAARVGARLEDMAGSTEAPDGPTSKATSVLVAEIHHGVDLDAVRKGVAAAPVSLLVGPAAPAGAHDVVIAFDQSLRREGLQAEFVGRGTVDEPSRAIAVLRGTTPPALSIAPASFRAVAIIVAYNEADVIAATVDHLNRQEVDTYLVDNWSTDGTADIARQAAGSRFVGVEHFPRSGPSPTFDLLEQLVRVEEIALELGASWIISNDADELRLSPWPGVTLRDALHHAQEEGSTAVNYTTLNFALTQDTFRPGERLEGHYPWFEPQRVASLNQLNTWRQSAANRVDLSSSGRHTVDFDGRRVFPFNFLLLHYPIRSVAQGLRKVNVDRLPRYRADERLRGWHDHYKKVQPSDLIRDPDGLLRYGPDFDADFLLQRLTAIGFEPDPTIDTFRLKTVRALRKLGVAEGLLRAKWRLFP